MNNAYVRYNIYLTLHATKNPLKPASLNTSFTVSINVPVGFTFCIIVFIMSKGMTHITFIKETKKEPTIRYLVGIFWSSGMLNLFLINFLIKRSAWRKLTQATLYRVKRGIKPLKSSFIKPPCWSNLFVPPLDATSSVMKNTFALSIGQVIRDSIRAIENPASNLEVFLFSAPTNLYS